MESRKNGPGEGNGNPLQYSCLPLQKKGLRRRKWQLTPVLLLGKSHGWRSLGGCSPWGRKESNMTSLSLSLDD